MLNGNIARLRKNRGLTQVEFAKQLHVTQSAVSHWESGRSVPDTVQLFRIAEFFGVSVETLSSMKSTPAQPKEAPAQAQEKAPANSIDAQIIKELEGADADLAREVLDYIKFKKQNRKG